MSDYLGTLLDRMVLKFDPVDLAEFLRELQHTPLGLPSWALQRVADQAQDFADLLVHLDCDTVGDILDQDWVSLPDFLSPEEAREILEREP